MIVMGNKKPIPKRNGFFEHRTTVVRPYFTFSTTALNVSG